MQHYLDEARAHRAQAKSQYVRVCADAPAGEPVVVQYRTRYREACDAVCEAQRRMDALHQEAIDYDKLVALSQLARRCTCVRCGGAIEPSRTDAGNQEMCGDCAAMADAGMATCAHCGVLFEIDGETAGDTLCDPCNDDFEAEQEWEWREMRANLHRGSR
jgi:hypothetical protein